MKQNICQLSKCCVQGQVNRNIGQQWKKKCSGGGKARSTSETTWNEIRTVTGDVDDVADDHILMIVMTENKTQKNDTSLQIVPNIESVGTAKQADVAREADTLTKLGTFNIASIYVIVLCGMVFQSSSFIVFFLQGASLLWPFHIWSLSPTDQGFLNINSHFTTNHHYAVSLK